MRRNGRLTAVLAALVFALGATSAMAETATAPTRQEYVSRLEGICKPRSEETQRVTRGLRADFKHGRTRLTTGKFAQATRIFGGTIRAIAAERRPTADAARLEKWFLYLNRQEAYLKQITAQLRLNHPIKAQRLTARFIENGNKANNTVLAFGFNYCSFKFIRYGF
ncbi:MAG: hypothetical protein WB507_06355 [Solirubrobacterales bacterium]